MRGGRSFKIDAFAESVFRSLDCDAVVCIDVMLAATTAVTCLAHGRRVFFVRTPEEARARARTLFDPILAHEAPRNGLQGFEWNAGPVSLGHRADVRRPLVLVSPLAQLLENAASRSAVYVACLRNLSATVRHLCVRHERVALISVGYAGELRCEDQLAAGWIGRALRKSGFDTEDMSTRLEVERWGGAETSVLALGKAADYLRRLGQQRELEFVLSHVDDLALVGRYLAGELTVAQVVRQHAPPAAAGMARSEDVVSAMHLAGANSRDVRTGIELERRAMSLDPTA
jgi:phosphosulfolactate phosphohydrolase-like enzyme